jgi:hypothetical protein
MFVPFNKTKEKNNKQGLPSSFASKKKKKK